MEDENTMSSPLPMESERDTNELRQHLKNTAFFKVETPCERLVKSIKANPFIPIGCVATLSALACGLWAFKNGANKKSQVMMRIRILSQGLALTAIIYGVVLEPRKH